MLVPPVLRVQPAQPEMQDQQVVQVPLEMQDQQVVQVLPVQQETKDPLALQE
jgi:hypothetical protein